ncbi:MAG TPA: sugar kinase [Spirochaetia bacterium]|nr:sugar kinase [Spirochaetia bacterium]
MSPTDKLTFRSEASCRYDFLALGALVQRFDPGLVPLHEASSFERHCSGAEYNPAANLAKCFGMRAAVATAIVQYPPGWWIESEVRKAGVTGCYKRFPYDGVRGPRMANTYSDRGIGVRAPEVWYDRANEAGALLGPGDFDWRELFESDGVRWFHSGGIFASLSPSSSELIIEGMKAAAAAGTVVSYDLNYRKKLWDASPGGSARSLEVNSAAVACSDVVFGNEEDLQLGLGIEGPEVSSTRSGLDARGFQFMIERTRARFPNLKAIATTLREVRSASRHVWKALLWYDGEFYESPTVELDVYDRIGGGDGFAAGLMYGFLSGERPQEALTLGWAHGALLTTYPGDITMARLEHVRALAKGGGARVIR